MNIDPRTPRTRTINGIHALTRLAPDLFYPVVDSVPPSFKLVADNGDLNYLADIVQANPRIVSETILIARPFALVSRAAELLSEATTTDSINSAAGWLHRAIMEVRSSLPRVAMLPIYWEGLNETPAEMIGKLAVFDVESIRLARRDGIRRLVGGFSEGTPKILDWPVYPGDTRDDWPDYYPALQKIHEAGANVVMLHAHEYIWTNGIPNKTIDRNEFVLQRYRCGRINDVYNRHIGPHGWNIATVISEGPLEDPRNAGLSDDMKLKWLTSPEWEALYCNEVKALTQYDWSATQDEQWQHYSLRPISKGMLAHISSYRPAGIIEVQPPVPDPELPPMSANLLTNPGFEGGSRKLSADWDVPNGWEPCYPGPGVIHYEVQNHPPDVLEGASAARVWQSGTMIPAGLKQKVSAEPGAEYQFMASGKAWSASEAVVGIPSDADILVKIGIDPTGGDDPLAPDVVWCPGLLPRDEYAPFTIKAAARSTAVTCYLLSTPCESRARSDTFWDVCTLEKTKDAPPPTPQVVEAWVKVTQPPGCNMRLLPTMGSALLGNIRQGTRLLVEYPAVNEYVKVCSQNFWIWANNITKES